MEKIIIKPVVHTHKFIGISTGISVYNPRRKVNYITGMVDVNKCLEIIEWMVI